MMNSADLVAKLLATENLTVIRTNSKTAYFDTKTRVLNIPLWKEMTPDIEGMLIGHEVGHALYTDGGKWTESVANDKILRGYLNVVEDARIEKLMKRRYPGIRKTFNAGYKQLVDRDFFKLKGRDLNTLLPIDRINLYFKVGYSAGIKFNTDEKLFVNQIENAETFEEVVAIAKAIYEYSKNMASELSEDDINNASEYSDEYEEDEFGEFEYDFDESEDGEEGDAEVEIESETNSKKEEEAKGSEGNDEKLESVTDSALNNGLEELADDSTEYRYYELCTEQFSDPIIPFKRIISETGSIDLVNQEDPNYRDTFEKFMIESDRMVNYLVKEFEMRKSAQAYKRAKVAKSGSLNLNKLHAYKICDDVFKRITTIPNGKNHGMIFLLDWSGSMSEVIIQTVKQVVNLAMFCRRIQIPFEVYAFSGSYNRRTLDSEYYSKLNAWNKQLSSISDKKILWSDSDFALLNLFSSKMTNNEFKVMARRFTSSGFQYCRGYSLGDTPLNEALVEMINFIPKYKKSNNIEKLTFITLTDGAGSNLQANTYVTKFGINPHTGRSIKIKNFLRDTQTGKDYVITGDSSSTTENLIRMIKDRYDVTTLGFYIVPNRRSCLSSVYVDHFNERANEYQIHEMRKQFKEFGFYSLKDTGRDDLFVIPDTSTKIVDEELEVDRTASAAAIARKFSKMFNTKKHSRVLLDRFIGYVA